MKQEESADLLKSHELSKQTNSHPSTSVECAKSVQVEMSVLTPLLTELVTLPKLVKTQLDASQPYQWSWLFNPQTKAPRTKPQTKHLLF